MINHLSINKTKYTVIIGLVICGVIALYLWAGSAAETPVDDTVVAMVSDRTITVDDLKKKMLQRSGGATQYFASPENKQALLEEMIQREIQITSAINLGYEQDPKFINTLENILVTKIREDKLKKVLAVVKVSDSEIEKYYQSNSEKYTSPAMSRVAIIYFSASKKASPETQASVKAKAQEAMKLAQTLPETVRGFGSLAANYSEDQSSRYIGGDIGWMVQGQESRFYKDAIVAETAAGLSKKNELSSLVQGDEGYYLVKLIDQKKSKTKTIEKVGGSIKRLLQQQIYEQAEENWLQSLEDELEPVVINQAVLSSVQPPPATQTEQQDKKPPALPKS